MNFTTHMDNFRKTTTKLSKTSKGPGVPFDTDPLAALSVHNLTNTYYVKTPTPADGNCFYHGIYDQIINNPNIFNTISEIGQQCTTAHQLRVECNKFINASQLLHENDTFIELQNFTVNHLKATNPSKYPTNLTNDKVWAIYTVEASKSGIFAEDLFITYMATFLAKDIYITAASNRDVWTRIASLVGTRGPPITLASNTHPNPPLHWRGEHFQSSWGHEK